MVEKIGRFLDNFGVFGGYIPLFGGVVEGIEELQLAFQGPDGFPALLKQAGLAEAAFMKFPVKKFVPLLALRCARAASEDAAPACFCVPGELAAAHAGQELCDARGLLWYTRLAAGAEQTPVTRPGGPGLLASPTR